MPRRGPTPCADIRDPAHHSVRHEDDVELPAEIQLQHVGLNEGHVDLHPSGDVTSCLESGRGEVGASRGRAEQCPGDGVDADMAPEMEQGLPGADLLALDRVEPQLVALDEAGHVVETRTRDGRERVSPSSNGWRPPWRSEILAWSSCW